MPIRRPLPSKPAKALSVLALAGALLVTGCATNAAPPTDAAGGTDGDHSTIRIANEAPITSIDPTLCGATEGSRLCYLLNGYLIEFGTNEPELAESLVGSEDNLTWTATLRPDLTFSDGSPLDAEDVVASIQRYLEPPLEGTVEVMRTIESVTALDELTVEFTLTQPDAEFVSSISYFRAAILPSDKLDGDLLATAPVGSGQYMIDSFSLSAGTFDLVANPNWWGEQPEVQRIEFTTVPDAATRYAQVQTGQVDYAKSLPANLIEQLPEELRVERVGFPGGMIHLVFNSDLDNGVAADTRVRQAINIAVDREQIAKVALGGYMDPLYGVPWIDPADRAAPIDRDLDAAKALLKGTACESGCTLRLVNITDFNWQLPITSTIVQQNLNEIGITVELVNTANSATAKIDPSAWDGAVLDPGYSVMTDTSIAESLRNFSWFGESSSFPELSGMVDELAIAPAEEATDLKQEINRTFAEQVPWVALTDLYFLDVTSLPDSVISSPIGWKLNIS